MKNLNLPSRASARTDLEDQIYTYQYKGQPKGYDPSDDELDRIVELYDLYDQTGGQVEDELKAGDLDAALRKSVRTAFSKTYADRQLAPLRERLLDGIGDCPICGIDPATQLDHFLPKSSFEVLAIYSRNLVPMCTACNKEKSSVVPEDRAEEFVHAYFDILPDTDFLVVQIDLTPQGLDVNFVFGPVANLPDQLRQRLSNQFEQLGLEKRYRREINLYVGAHAVSFHGLFEAGGSEAVKVWLQRQTVQETHRFHRNDWRSSVFRALAEHDEFCDGGFAVAFPLLE